jgi:glucan phosphoethanolaminetransferase (alkaline phosphatase superfamily)
MLFYIFQNIIFSILIIFIGNQIWEYLKNKYSTKITKDLVDSQVQKYKQMIEEIQSVDRQERQDKQEKKNKTEGQERQYNNMEEELESFIGTI